MGLIFFTGPSKSDFEHNNFGLIDEYYRRLILSEIDACIKLVQAFVGGVLLGKLFAFAGAGSDLSLPYHEGDSKSLVVIGAGFGHQFVGRGGVTLGLDALLESAFEVTIEVFFDNFWEKWE